MAQAIDPTSDRPVYKQIADLLRAAIQSGELGPGARVPSEQELIDAHGVARGTIRQAVRLLPSEGLLEVQHGRGAFVRNRPPVRRLGHDRFAREKREQGKAGYLADMESQGREPGVEVLEVGPSKASERRRTRRCGGSTSSRWAARMAPTSGMSGSLASPRASALASR